MGSPRIKWVADRFDPELGLAATTPFSDSLYLVQLEPYSAFTSSTSIMSGDIKRSGQNTPDEKWTESPPSASERIDDTESIAQLAVVDAATEKRLLRKLDMRIIPMICWIYLMNFMDRGE
jgi:hypothetical protein